MISSSNWSNTINSRKGTADDSDGSFAGFQRLINLSITTASHPFTPDLRFRIRRDFRATENLPSKSVISCDLRMIRAAESAVSEPLLVTRPWLELTC